MPLIIELRSTTAHEAQVLVDDVVLSTFDPLALRKKMPRREMIDEKGRKRVRTEVVAFGTRLWHALGGETFGELVDELPLAHTRSGVGGLTVGDVVLS